MASYINPEDTSTAGFNHATEAVHYIERLLPTILQKPRLGIICGSGLGGLAETVLPQPRQEIPYAAVPHFPSSTGLHAAIWCRSCSRLLNSSSPRSRQ